MTIVSSVPRGSLSRSSVHHTALEACAAGMSVVPIRTDGTKQPRLSTWRVYQRRQANEVEVNHWFGNTDAGIAFVTGAVSRNLEALDFDCHDTFEAWLRRIQQDPGLAALYDHLSWGYLEATPAGGRHLLYRCDRVEGNQRLATRPDGEKRQTLIETRGEGGLIIVAPSHGTVHPSGKPYLLLRGGVSSIRTITAHQRALLFSVARAFDELPPANPCVLPSRKVAGPLTGGDDLRPGDLFNRAASWEEILIPHGWELVRWVADKGEWRRPGKQGPGISATTNWEGSDLLYVFSTSTVFEPERGYSKFSAYALLSFGGDFHAAAHHLATSGSPTSNTIPFSQLWKRRSTHHPYV